MDQQPDGRVVMPRREEAVDPFGRRVGERLWRRLAGAAVAVVPVSVGFVLWTTELLPFVLIAGLVVYLLGVPASWLVVRRGGAPVRRHVVAAVVVGVGFAGGLALIGGDIGWALVYAGFSVGLGVPLAALAAWSGLALPTPLVRPVALVGFVAVVVGLPVATWLQQRPPAPHDFVVVHEPQLIRDHAGDAPALAELIARRFEDRPPARRTAHTTWASIGQELGDQELANVAHGMRFTGDEERPILRRTGEPGRLVTTIFEGEQVRGCVIVTGASARAVAAACRELDLTD